MCVEQTEAMSFLYDRPWVLNVRRRAIEPLRTKTGSRGHRDRTCRRKDVQYARRSRSVLFNAGLLHPRSYLSGLVVVRRVGNDFFFGKFPCQLLHFLLIRGQFFEEAMKT